MYSKPTKILSKSNLLTAWQNSRDSSRKAGRPGIDNVTAQQFAAKLDYNLTVIARQLRTGSYGFARLKPVFIPKPNSSKERMICIPTVRDRVVQRAIGNYLTSRRCFPVYNSSSFGFIRGRRPADAVNAAVNLRTRYEWCLKTDIESFFDRIPRPYLKDRIGSLMQSHSLCPLIFKIIDLEVKELPINKAKIERQGVKRGMGVRQGMPLSPLLANLTLSKFDRQIETRKIPMIRYADDLALFFNSRQDAKIAKDIVSALLGELELTIPKIASGAKTQLLGPDDPLDFLGREIVRVGVDKKYVARVSNRQIEKIKRYLEEEYSFQNRSKSDATFLETVVDLWRSISAYLGIYKDAYNYMILDSELRGTARTIMSDTFLDIFGADALDKITDEAREFLGIGTLDVPEPLNDLDL